MGNIKIVRGVFDTKLELEHAGVAAVFPSPAEDYRHETLDFNRDYIRHPEASFFRYSIDECFIYLDGMEHLDLKRWGEGLHKKIKQYVGMPVSIPGLEAWAGQLCTKKQNQKHKRRASGEYDTKCCHKNIFVAT